MIQWRPFAPWLTAALAIGMGIFYQHNLTTKLAVERAKTEAAIDAYVDAKREALRGFHDSTGNTTRHAAWNTALYFAFGVAKAYRHSERQRRLGRGVVAPRPYGRHRGVDERDNNVVRSS